MSVVVAGEEIVAAALAELTRELGARVGRVRLVASFLGEEEIDRRLKWALLLSLEDRFRRLRASRVNVWATRDDDTVNILPRLGYDLLPAELEVGWGGAAPVSHAVMRRREALAISFAHAEAGVTVTVSPPSR